jgi:group I intron endonuclease
LDNLYTSFEQFCCVCNSNYLVYFTSFPLIVYSNPDTEKVRILLDNKNKSGIYRWVNLVSGKSYIGSSANLSRRFRDYYSIAWITQRIKGTSIITRALLKYGYSGFKLEILEYCESKDVIQREQYYLDKFKPEYNILKTAGSMLGRKHTEATKEKMRGVRGAYNISPERRAQLIENIYKFHSKPITPEHLEKLRVNISKLNAKRALGVVVTDTETGDSVEYESFRQAARELDITRYKLRTIIESNKLFKGKYKISTP